MSEKKAHHNKLSEEYQQVSLDGAAQATELRSALEEKAAARRQTLWAKANLQHVKSEIARLEVAELAQVDGDQR